MITTSSSTLLVLIGILRGDALKEIPSSKGSRLESYVKEAYSYLLVGFICIVLARVTVCLSFYSYLTSNCVL